ncbi:hypothetical protein ACHAWF_001357, partial [Thalassiosira exigua]
MASDDGAGDGEADRPGKSVERSMGDEQDRVERRQLDRTQRRHDQPDAENELRQMRLECRRMLEEQQRQFQRQLDQALEMPRPERATQRQEQNETISAASAATPAHQPGLSGQRSQHDGSVPRTARSGSRDGSSHNGSAQNLSAQNVVLSTSSLRQNTGRMLSMTRRSRPRTNLLLVNISFAFLLLVGTFRFHGALDGNPISAEGIMPQPVGEEIRQSTDFKMPQSAERGTLRSTDRDPVDASRKRRASEDDHASYNQVFGVEDPASSGASPAKHPRGRPPSKQHFLLDPSSSPVNVTVIPRIVHKIFFQKPGGFPRPSSLSDELASAHRSWTEMNPGHEVRYYDLRRARDYLADHFHPVFLRAFDCLPAFAAKSDLFRMTLLYREGGWHSDWKQLCLQKNLLRNISDVTDFFAVYDLWNSDDVFWHKCVQNAFVGSKPQHPILAKMLEMLLLTIQEERYPKTALAATATCTFGRAVKVSERDRKSTQFEKVAGQFKSEP